MAAEEIETVTMYFIVNPNVRERSQMLVCLGHELDQAITSFKEVTGQDLESLDFSTTSEEGLMFLVSEVPLLPKRRGRKPRATA